MAGDVERKDVADPLLKDGRSERNALRGRLVARTWEYNPALYAPARYRRACRYEVFVPDTVAGLDIVLPGDVAGVVSDAEKVIADLNRDAGAALNPLARLLLRTESIASSKIEGMQVDARTLARAEANQETGRSVGPEAAEILGNIDAMQLAIERASGAGRIGAQDIRDIHAVLMEHDTRARRRGEFRDSQNWIGGNDYNPCGADFVPPPAEEVPPLIDDVSEFCADESLPPLVQAALAHAQFETIHPFEDGNGRTGRALVQIILRRRDVAPGFVPPISVVLAREKARYIRGLTLFRENRVAEWVEIFAVAAAQAAQLAVHYLGRVSDLQAEWRRRLRESSSPRAGAAAWTIIDLLPAHPIITTAIGVAATGRTRPAVANAIQELVDAGVLLPLSQSARNRAWEADSILDLIVGLESGTE
jgi:Fic family protein